ncbi:MAG TPA: sigma-70 family RNA polymerase sigma factor [Acidimicrobiales bacterium]
MSDEALLAGLAGGGPEVGLAFVRRFQRHIFGVALAVLGEASLAEDVAQQTFVRAWRAAPGFDSTRGSVRTWLTTIAHNLAVDAARGRKSTPLDPSDLVRLMGPGFDEPEQLSMRKESAAELRQAIGSLPAEQARAVVMAGVYGFTAQQVADAEDIPLGTAKTRIRSAMHKLRSALDPGVLHHG